MEINVRIKNTTGSVALYSLLYNSLKCAENQRDFWSAFLSCINHFVNFEYKAKYFKASAFIHSLIVNSQGNFHLDFYFCVHENFCIPNL